MPDLIARHQRHEHLFAVAMRLVVQSLHTAPAKQRLLNPPRRGAVSHEIPRVIEEFGRLAPRHADGRSKHQPGLKQVGPVGATPFRDEPVWIPHQGRRAVPVLVAGDPRHRSLSLISRTVRASGRATWVPAATIDAQPGSFVPQTAAPIPSAPAIQRAEHASAKSWLGRSSGTPSAFIHLLSGVCSRPGGSMLSRMERDLSTSPQSHPQ